MDAWESNAVSKVRDGDWSPPLPAAEGFDHFKVHTPGLVTHVAAVGDGVPVLLLHGFPQHWWQWRTIAPAIAEHGYRVICPDLRGAGWTVAEDSRVNRDARLHDLLAILDVLNLEKVHVIAHDMGVITAIQLAYGYPQRVHSLVQLSVPPAFIKISLKALPAFKHLSQFFVHKSGASLRHVFSKDFLARPLSETDIDNYLLPMQRPAVDGAVRHLYRGMVFQEALRMASGAYRRQTLTVPTLIVLGRPGKPWTEELVVQGCPHPDQYASQLEFSYIENAAHFITDDDPAGVAHVLINWLQHAGYRTLKCV